MLITYSAIPGGQARYAKNIRLDIQNSPKIAPGEEGVNESRVPTHSMFRGCVVPYLELSSSSQRLTA